MNWALFSLGTFVYGISVGMLLMSLYLLRRRNGKVQSNP